MKVVLWAYYTWTGLEVRLAAGQLSLAETCFWGLQPRPAYRLKVTLKERA